MGDGRGEMVDGGWGDWLERRREKIGGEAARGKDGRGTGWHAISPFRNIIIILITILIIIVIVIIII